MLRSTARDDAATLLKEDSMQQRVLSSVTPARRPSPLNSLDSLSSTTKTARGDRREDVTSACVDSVQVCKCAIE